MLKNIFDTVLRLTNPAPRYVGTRCLVERQAVGGCDHCMSVCPHEAVQIGSVVKISEDACTGCGLCVQVCPTAALEYDLLPMLGALKDQGLGATSSTTLRCSKVQGDGPSIHCLGRVTPALLLVSQAWGQNLELQHADCANCKIGSADVPQKVQAAIDQATTERANLEPNTLSVRMTQTNTQAQAPAAQTVSRRDAFSNIFGRAKQSAAKAIPDNPIPGIDTSAPNPRIPDEWTWRRKAKKPSPTPETLVRWPTPTVNDDCVMCPVCQNVCPTDAITRERHQDFSYSLTLEVAACTGCNACVVSCPPNAMQLQPQIEFEKLLQTMLLHEDDGSSQY